MTINVLNMLWCINHYTVTASRKDVRRIIIWVSVMRGNGHGRAQQGWHPFRQPVCLPRAVQGSIHQGDRPPYGCQRVGTTKRWSGRRVLRGRKCPHDSLGQRMSKEALCTFLDSFPSCWKLILFEFVNEMSYNATSCWFLNVSLPCPFFSGQGCIHQEISMRLSWAVSETLSQGRECFELTVNKQELTDLNNLKLPVTLIKQGLQGFPGVDLNSSTNALGAECYWIIKRHSNKFNSKSI